MRTQAGGLLNVIIAGGHAVPGERLVGASGSAAGRNGEDAVDVVWIGSRKVVLFEGHAFAGGVGAGILVGSAEVRQKPGDGKAIGCECAGRDGVRLHVGDSIAESDPAAVGAPDRAAELARHEVHVRRTVAFKINPANVGAPSVTTEIAEAVAVHSKIIRCEVLIIDPVGGGSTAEVDPADIRGIRIPRAHVAADDRAIGGITRPVNPAEIRAVSVFARGINGGCPATVRRCDQQEN